MPKDRTQIRNIRPGSAPPRALRERPRAPAEPSNIRVTPQESAFCDHWLRYRNAGEAYRHCIRSDTSPASASQTGSKLLRQPHIQAELTDRFKRFQMQANVDVPWLLQRYVDIATADVRELINLRIGCCRYCHGEGHAYQWREREFMDQMGKAERQAAKDPDTLFPDVAGGFGYDHTRPPCETCPECRGEGIQRIVPQDSHKFSEQAALLYGGVKVRRDGGYEIIVADREKALEQIGRIMGAFTDGLKLSGNVGALFAVADLAKMDPREAAAKYQDFVRGQLAANPMEQSDRLGT